MFTFTASADVSTHNVEIAAAAHHLPQPSHSGLLKHGERFPWQREAGIEVQGPR